MDRDIGHFAVAPAPNLVAFAASLSSCAPTARSAGPPVPAGSLRPLRPASPTRRLGVWGAARP